MAFSKIVARPSADSSTQRVKNEEFDYYKNYVAACVRKTEETVSLEYIKLNTSLFRMLEILLEKFHDIDAKNSLAGNVIFHSVALSQALNITMYIEDGRSDEPRRQDPRIYASELCLNAKTTSDAYHRFAIDPTNSVCAEALAYELLELIDIANNIAEVRNLHELLSINIQKRGGTDKFLQERYLHIKRNPYMKIQMETNSIYPLLYRWPIHNMTFCLLLKQAKVELTENFLQLQEVIEKLSSYVTYLLQHEQWTDHMVTIMLENAFNTRMFVINIHDPRSFLGPVSRNLHAESYATHWNRKYPSMGYLLAATPAMEDGQTLRADVLSMRTPQGWNTDLILDEAWKNKLHKEIVETFRRNQADQSFPPTLSQVATNQAATTTSTSSSPSASYPLLRQLLTMPPPNIIVPTFIPPPTTPNIKKYVQIHVGQLPPATISQLRKRQLETEHPQHHSTDVNPVDLSQNSSTEVHKRYNMYKVILPTWYTATTPDGQPKLSTGQWSSHSGTVSTTSTSSPEASASYSFTATTAVPEATASPSASATSAAAPTTVDEPTELMEFSTPTTASTAAMEINNVLTDDTPAASPLA